MKCCFAILLLPGSHHSYLSRRKAWFDSSTPFMTNLDNGGVESKNYKNDGNSGHCVIVSQHVWRSYCNVTFRVIKLKPRYWAFSTNSNLLSTQRRVCVCAMMHLDLLVLVPTFNKGYVTVNSKISYTLLTPRNFAPNQKGAQGFRMTWKLEQFTN